ncbi:helicase domino-like isoform X2 [Saccostrea cucullata]|uniref:helicase domino-like isoform X2 n=1 Tax=Saccostrea cuccullata TaxID=36930 RepID=UPI002ED13BC4
MQNDERQMAEEQHQNMDGSNVVFQAGVPQTVLVHHVHSTQQQLLNKSDAYISDVDELQRPTQGSATQGERSSTVGTGTIHHIGQSPSSGGQSSRPNLPQQHIVTMSNQTPKSTSSLAGGSSSAAVSSSRASVDSKPPALNLTFPNLTALANQSGPSPKKKIKLEEKPAATHEIANHRKLILDLKYKSMLDIKEPYIDNLTEMFFLQNGGNLMDFLAWKKRPTPQLVHFLKSGSLDSDDEEEGSLERKINNEVKVITCSGSNVPLATPVAISTTLPPSVAALNQQGFDPRRPGGRHGMIFGHVQHLTQPPTILPILQAAPIILPGTGAVSTDSLATKSTTQSVPAQRIVTTSVTTVTLSTPLTMPQLHSHLAKAITDSKPPTAQTSSTKSTVTAASPIVSVTTAVKTTKSPPISPSVQQPKTPTISGVYDGAPGVGTQEAIVERAKQEAQVMQRVSELRKEGLWSTRKLPKVQEPPRNKGHWDYLLEEMQWLAADFAQERKWKKAAARKVAKMVSKYFQDLEQKEIRAEKEEGLKLKKIASQMAKQIREFWTNIEKVVQYKAQARLEEKRKKALDLHLNFIVDQTEKYSTWLTEGLKKEGTSIGSGSNVATPAHSDAGDEEFRPAKEDESDDEETIEKEEAEQDPLNTKAELDALQKESELPFEELLKTLPKEVLENPVPVPSDEADEEDKKDKEFKATEDEKDEEDTIAEQEKHEKKIDYSKELDDLKDESEMTMEELYRKYAGAYDSDFEMPEEEEEDSEEEDSDDEEEEDESEEEEEEEEEEESMEEESTEKDDVGLEFLTKKDEDSKSQGDFDQEGPGKEITDIAAQAQSLQPKGYTLETTTVKTAVPFLLKHTLREYQHVGLNWLATMYEQRLNGILADEMGLGKTIQTIALLAHLACEKGIWGPHLIVVPTSVMLNWEMEIKKWCPAFKILTYYGSLKERKLKRQGWTKTNAFHICITSYKLVIQDHQSFRRKKWKYFILDEAQNIKNFKSQRWQTLLNFSSQRRLLLTGTPLQNSLMELWSLMHFLMPHVFQSHREFKEWFANPLTGMIEGSHEYNESLIKRLHKVLRPFLLRRLKKDVEKQMPKKYEHVVMCHLSKRQRYLYDDFMSQTKTKETLASGHFMSVINILMQLRKVCNHPSLFDPRPIVSPFKTEGINYFVPSLVLNCLDYDPFKDVDLHSLYPSLADMELNLPAFVAHRVKKLQTPRVLIEEIDSHQEPPSRPRSGKLKPVVFKGIAPVQPTGRITPTTSDRTTPASTAVQSALKTETVNGVQVENTQTPVTNTSATVQPPAKVVAQPAGQTGVQQPLTVHIQQTDQGARLMIPAGQLSQLPAGFIQIVQTSTGQQIIATSTPMSTSSQILASIPTSSVQALSVATTSSTVVNGPPTITTVASSTSSTLVTSVNAQVKTTPAVQLPSSSTIVTGARPVMRVSPLSSVAPVTSNQDPSVSKPSTAQVTTTMSHSSTKMSVLDCENLHNKSSRFYMASLTSKLQDLRKQKLEYIAKINKRRCECKPVYGQDLCDAVDVFKDMNKTSVKDNTWKGLGMAYCRNVKCWRNPNHPDIYWKQTTVLSELVHSPMDYLCELKDILSRFVFVTPPIVSPQIQLHASHPSPSYLNQQRRTEFCLRQHISPKTECLHQISSRMTVQFPELRLIQYDCGKLQTMDILLRQLKSENHRVLIFTQMTKMLNILEAFLNFHGHRYLRLDGTTKVDQRQFLMDRFNADKRIFAFILSTRSGGIGVNLTGADTVIFYDSDWNPTMDAQAQDRCHRIGQTRDVHIYRLISERTVEENILKKANQKRMLGDMAIEGGNFTTAFFKEQTIQELFTEPSGLQSLADEITESEKVKETVTELKEDTKAGGDAKEENMVQSEKNVMAQFEKVLAKAEDETDAQAVDLVKAEQKAELAEFDENIPWDEREAELKKEEELSKVEQEIAMLDKELTPVERYAVNFMELEMDPMEELEMGEEDIENVKKDWELGRLKALKEEEERRAELEEDEMLYIYYRDDTYNQVFLSDVDQEKMPLWAPPTPPHDDNDIYLDQSLLFLYEPNVMPETQLPPVYIKKEHKKPKIESITTRQKKQRKEEQTRVPRSLFDRPSAQLLKIRREHKQKSGLLKPFRPVPPPIVKPNVDTSDHPEWLIHEDWALLQAVQSLFDVPLNLLVVSPAHHPNWDLVADVVNTCSRVYRSAKQCKNRYENVIIPREEGRILYDINPRKQSKKTKGIYKTKNNRPMRTSQLYIQDNNQAVTMLYSFRFESAKQIAGKRPPPLKQTLVNPTLKNPKHATVLSENNINYDQPLNPMSVAEIRAQRIQREKKQNQAAAQATADQQLAAQRSVVQTAATTGTTVVQQTTTSVAVAPVAQPIQTAVVSSAVLTGVVQKAAAVGQVAVTRTATGNIVVNTQGGVPTNFAAINRRMSQQATVASIAQPATVTVAGAITPANIRAQRTAAPLTIQEITAIASQPQTQVTTSIASGPQVARTQLQTTVTGAQLATVQRTNTGQQLTQQTVTKNLTPQQLLQLQQRQQNLINQQKMQQQQVQQQQQLRMQKLNLTQQQLKQLQQQGRAQKTVIAQQLVTGVGQLTAAQLIPQAQVQHITQSATVAGTSGTLVKTVSAPGIPVSTVNINVSVPQQKGIVGKSATVSQIPQAKIQHIQQIQQQMRHQLTKQPQKITSVGQPVGKGQSFPLNAVQIIQQPASGATRQHLTYSLQQFMQQNKGSGMIITSQPIITTVTQSQQPTGQMVTKVLPTSAVPTTHLQTLSATPISVTHVSAVQASNVTAQPAATSISLTGVGGQAGKPLTVTTVAQDASTGTTIQVQPATTGTQQGSQTTTQQLIPQTQVVQQVPLASHTPQKILTQTAHQIQVTPGSIQQVQAGNIAQAVSATPTAVTLTITPAAQSAPSTGTLIQQPVVVTQAVQATSQPSTVTSQAALAAAAALPTTTVTVASAVQSSTQSQQTTPGSAKPAAPYAMRTRNHPKT